MAYERAAIERLSAYVPGEQPREPGVVKLNTNENPYPPVEGVMAAIRGVAAESLRRYPPPAADGFRAAAGRAHGVAADQVIATNGGDELLRLAVTVFCEPGGTAGGLGGADPSYSLYSVLAAIHDTPRCAVGLESDFALPADIADTWNEAGCRLAMLVRPHAPSGRLEPIERIARVADRFRGVLLVDEAYVDFASDDALSLLDGTRDNVLLLRSLSKGYGLAGLRFGYGVGPRGLIAALEKARDSYNTNALAQAAAEAAIERRAEAARTWRAVTAERARLAAALTERGWRVWPSEANFLLARPPGGTAARLKERLAERGILVRHFDVEGLREALRITVGTPEQNDALLAAADASA